MFYDEENLLLLFEQLKEIINECRQNELLNELYRIKNMIYEPYFTLSVVGEFSRGKSTIINKLLKKDILPIGVLPTTARLTYITYGEEDKLKIIRPDCIILEHELSEKAWDSILYENETYEDNNSIQVLINNTWLKETGVRLIDSPGAGDLNYGKLNMIIDTISSSDGVFIAINCTMALSLTEKNFIEQHIVSKKIPKIAVVLTKLDLINDIEKEQIISYVRNKIKAISDKTLLLTLNDNISSQELDIKGVKETRNLINNWVKDEERQQEKLYKIKYQTLQLLNLLKNALIVIKEKFSGEYDEFKKKIDLELQNFDKSEIKWKKIEIELKKRHLDTANMLHNLIKNKKDDIVKKLQSHVENTGNPREWWFNQLPYIIRQEMLSVAKSLEETLKNKFIQDMIWMETSISDKSREKKVYKDFISINIEPADSQALNLRNLGARRSISRIGFGISTVIGYCLFGSFGALVTIGGGIISEKMFQDSMEQQRQYIRDELEKLVENSFKKNINCLNQRMEETCSKILFTFKEQKENSLKLQKNVIENMNVFDKDDLNKVNEFITKLNYTIDKLEGDISL